ncbi:MAG: site-specific integrase [Acidobacteria bacterium]|nr:site-specific integrase [Acidobacteriota bacterium]
MADKERKPTRDPEGSILKKVETRRTANGKTRKETVYYARVRQNEYDEHGRFVKTHEMKRRAESYAAAIIMRRQMRSEIHTKIKEIKIGKAEKRIYFFDLLDFYEKHYVKEVVFSANGKKIAGQRTPIYQTKKKIEVFREFFGNIPVASISYARLFEFKLSLEETKYKITRKILLPKTDPKQRKNEYTYVDEWRSRKPATIHRYLACLRRILYIGLQQGFATVNPFKLGDPLIVASIEETRTRICSFEEEQKILAECVGPREHLKHVLIIAIDTFLRENEIFSLVGADVDFQDRLLTVREQNSKTLKSRTVPLSGRAYQAFIELRGDKLDGEWLNSKVFPFRSIKTAWYSILKNTDIQNLHFHDLRGTGITRMLEAGVPAPIVMKFSGHTQHATFMKYVKKDLQMIQNAGEALNELYRRQQEKAKGQIPLSQQSETELEEHRDATDLTKSIH